MAYNFEPDVKIKSKFLKNQLNYRFRTLFKKNLLSKSFYFAGSVLIYRTTSVSAKANEFFRVRTNREGELSERACFLAVHFLTHYIRPMYFSNFFDKKPLILSNILRFLAFFSKETLM